MAEEQRCCSGLWLHNLSALFHIRLDVMLNMSQTMHLGIDLLLLAVDFCFFVCFTCRLSVDNSLVWKIISMIKLHFESL